MAFAQICHVRDYPRSLNWVKQEHNQACPFWDCRPALGGTSPADYLLSRAKASLMSSDTVLPS